MAHITPQGISHSGKCICWADIEQVNIITDEFGSGIIHVWVKSRPFTGTIHPSLQNSEAVKSLIVENLNPDKVKFNDFSPSFRFMAKANQFVAWVIWFLLVATITAYVIVHRPNPLVLLRQASELSAMFGPVAVLLFLLGIHMALFVDEFWAEEIRRWRYRYLRTDAPEKIARDHGIIAATIGGCVTLLASFMGSWHGLVAAILGAALLLGIKKIDSRPKLRENLAILVFMVIFVALLIERWISI